MGAVEVKGVVEGISGFSKTVENVSNYLDRSVKMIT